MLLLSDTSTECVMMEYSHVLYMFFFFKQKTAYEMRISDWSSDVCSSDLPRLPRCRRARAGARRGEKNRDGSWRRPGARPLPALARARQSHGRRRHRRRSEERVYGKSVSVRVVLGGCRTSKKPNNTK